MLHVLGCLTQQHDLRLVALAGFICVLACWTSVSLASRARVNAGRTRLMWLFAAGVVFGAGVWATHFVSMLAYQSSMQIGFDLAPTVLSILVAVGLSVPGFAVVLRGRPFSGGAILGVAVCAMHFTGMWAVEGPFVLAWSATYVIASLVLSVSLAMAAAFAGISIRNYRGRIVATALLVLSICALHFTAMSAVTLIPDSKVFYDDIVLAPGTLAIAIAAVALLIVALGLVAALLDSHLVRRRTDEAARLRAYIAELEETHRALETTSTDLKDALVKASAASDAKSAFLAAMSHELRTPLNAVIGFSELLLTERLGPLGDARYREYISDIQRSGVHLLGIVNDVLDLSRLDAGKAALHEETVSLGYVLDDALRMVAAQAQQAGIELSHTIEQRVPDVRVDIRLVTQVFLNILSNAIKFTPAGGHVRASLECLDDGVRVRISDTGIGIAREDIAQALERFGQVDNRLARKYEGTGLGLPLAKQLVELHGGTLTLESEPDAGTKVTIMLPASRLVRCVAVAAE